MIKTLTRQKLRFFSFFPYLRTFPTVKKYREGNMGLMDGLNELWQWRMVSKTKNQSNIFRANFIEPTNTPVDLMTLMTRLAMLMLLLMLLVISVMINSAKLS